MCVVCGCSDNSPAHARHVQTQPGEAAVVAVNPANGDLHFGAGAARVSVPGMSQERAIKLETDILGGVQLGFHTVLVLSGGTRPDDLGRYAFRPEIVVDSLAELNDLMDEHGWRSPWQSEGEAPADGPDRRTPLRRRPVAVVG